MKTDEFEKVVRQYEKLVFTVCYQLVRDYHEAQNLTQETFLRLTATSMTTGATA